MTVFAFLFQFNSLINFVLNQPVVMATLNWNSHLVCFAIIFLLQMMKYLFYCRDKYIYNTLQLGIAILK